MVVVVVEAGVGRGVGGGVNVGFITSIGIPQYIQGELVSQNIDDPLMKAITSTDYILA